MARDEKLLELRNQRIKSRYYELMNAGKRGRRRRVYADEVLATLSKEFFLTKRSLIDIIYSPNK